MDVLAERILQDLRNTFKKDPLINEFDILPVEESLSNKCPVLYVDHKVALEKWCVKHVYVYAYTKFFAWRKGQKCGEIADPESLMTLTCAILLINPGLETAWNARKEMILQSSLLPFDELKFSELVLSHRPKVSPVYAHRQWVLQNYSTIIPLEHEFFLCSRWADLYPSNYYAWGHRLWVIKNLGNNKPKVIQDDLACTEGWVTVHVSDHCGFHYRQQLISALQPATPVLQKEIALCTELQRSYPGHEALWAHRKFLLWASSNQPKKGLSERKSFDCIHCAEDSSECIQAQCPASDNVQIHLNNITYINYNSEMREVSFDRDNSDRNGHINAVKNPLDYDGVSNVLHSETVHQTANFRCENDNLDKKDLIETVKPLYWNGVVHNAEELPSSFVHSHNCDEEVLKREVEFVRERQNAARHWPWESLLLQRHLKWVSEVLGWRQLRSR